ncbi:hypothetical protein BG011_001571 [Mortierella polycephala]|uniref:C2H2-type domain-containing protein n=1 Tax=Mortierella polycephala TaxID=41804 RepID=A0A9P6Q534_9FUNG|nr:hypothetical protein BG011_001571 [Mortierella polycephala]
MHIQKQSLGIDRGPDFHERGNGSWSDGGAGAGYEPRTGHKRGGRDNLSESHSVSISSASHWKESERVIRPSFSEPDLTAMDAVQRKRKLTVDPSKDNAEENEEVDNEELEAEEEVDELEEDEESGGHDSYKHPRQPPHSQQGYAYEYGNGSEPARYSQSPSRDGQQRPHPPPHFQHPPPLPHGRPQPMHHTHHPQVPSYHGVPMHQQHIYDYPSQPLQGHPPHQTQRNPRAFSHPYISQFQVQLPQYPQQDASSFHSTYPNGHPIDPKAPNRRGPYLSRQRALLAGLETTSPSSRYQCQYCHKRFSRPSSLRIHTYSHTGERPFKCSEEGCGRQFSVQSNMRRHLRVHRLGRMRSEFPSSN